MRLLATNYKGQNHATSTPTSLAAPTEAGGAVFPVKLLQAPTPTSLTRLYTIDVKPGTLLTVEL